MNYPVIYASAALWRTKEARARLKEEALERIALLEHADPITYAVFFRVGATIKAACNRGQDSVILSVDELWGNESWTSRELSVVTNELRNLGYGSNFSCSSSRRNERLTISWSRTEY
jgi:hypothetical protein